MGLIFSVKSRKVLWDKVILLLDKSIAVLVVKALTENLFGLLLVWFDIFVEFKGLIIIEIILVYLADWADNWIQALEKVLFFTATLAGIMFFWINHETFVNQLFFRSFLSIAHAKWLIVIIFIICSRVIMKRHIAFIILVSLMIVYKWCIYPSGSLMNASFALIKITIEIISIVVRLANWSKLIEG